MKNHNIVDKDTVTGTLASLSIYVMNIYEETWIWKVKGYCDSTPMKKRIFPYNLHAHSYAHGDVISRHGTWSTLVHIQIMACRLFGAPYADID